MKNWEIVKISTVIDVRDGTHDSPKYVLEGFPLLTSKNLVNGSLLFDEVNYVSKEDYDEINKRSKVDIGDILYSMIGSIGNLAIVDKEPSFAIKNVALFKFDNECINNKFFFYLLRSSQIKRQIENQQRGGTQQFVSLKILRNLQIPLPPLETQKKIAAILDAADEYRQKTKALIEKYDQLAQSLFLEMFGDPVRNEKGWEVKNLSELAVIEMGQSPSGESYNTVGQGTPLLNGPTEFGLKFPIIRQWTTDPRKICKVNDILFCVRGATAGRMNWANQEYSIGRGLASIRSKGYIDIKYLYIILERMYQIFQNTSNGSTFINICKDDLLKINIPLTSKEVQNQFAERIQLIEHQKQQAQSSLQKAEELFNSLLQRAFKGELV